MASEVKSPAEKFWNEATTIDRTVDRIRADAEAVALATDGATGRSLDVADELDVDLGYLEVDSGDGVEAGTDRKREVSVHVNDEIEPTDRGGQNEHPRARV